MKPGEVITRWIEFFNKADAENIAALYHDDAINHQVNSDPVTGKEAIRKMFANEFAAAKMVCIPENIFEDGDWAIVEWRDPLGLRGCGFFTSLMIKLFFKEVIGISLLFYDCIICL